MTDTFDYISRFVVIVFGYCVAVLAAGFFLAAILYSQIDVLGYALSDPFFQDVFNEIRDAWDMTGFYAAVLIGGPVLATMAGGFSFFPAVVLIVISEVRGWKSSLPYCIGGLVIGLLYRSSDRRLCMFRHRRRLRLLADCRSQRRAIFRAHPEKCETVFGQRCAVKKIS